MGRDREERNGTERKRKGQRRPEQGGGMERDRKRWNGAQGGMGQKDETGHREERDGTGQ